MTELVKAPDIRVVKSAAKALRTKASSTVKISHSMALEIAANAFGFTSWHACRSHFKHIEEGVFSAKEPVEASSEFNHIAQPLCDFAKSSDLTFTLGEITAEAISAIRTPDLAVDILALGAISLPTFDVQLPDSWLNNIVENTTVIFDGKEVYFTGSIIATQASMITSENILQCFADGMARVREISLNGDVDVMRVKHKAQRTAGSRCIMIPKIAVTRIGQMAQVEINLRHLAQRSLEV